MPKRAVRFGPRQPEPDEVARVRQGIEGGAIRDERSLRGALTDGLGEFAGVDRG